MVDVFAREQTATEALLHHMGVLKDTTSVLPRKAYIAILDGARPILANHDARRARMTRAPNPLVVELAVAR